MELEYLCLKCMCNKGMKERCPFCGFHEGDYSLDGFQLKLRTVLNDRYLIGASLGKGGFGITYIAWDMKLSIAVAIKEYYPSNLAFRNSGDKTLSLISKKTEKLFNEYLEKFLDEARTLAQFQNEAGIVSVQDYFRENGTIYIVMFYVNGETLENYIKSRGNRISYQETIRIMKGVMKSLNKVHKEGLIHRDISPDNIYITGDNEVRLLDFGAARYVVGNNKDLSVILKRGYAPYEQYSENGKQGPWSDVYATGATMYRVMSGMKPQEASDRIIEDNLKSLREIGIDIPKKLDDAIMKALALKPRDRFHTMEEFLRALLTDGIEKKEEEGTLLLQSHKRIDIKGVISGKKKIIMVVGLILVIAVSGIMVKNIRSPVHKGVALGGENGKNVVVKFKDKAFEDYVRRLMHKEFGDIMSRELPVIDKMTIDGEGRYTLTTLEDLKWFPQLEELRVHGGILENLRGIENLKNLKLLKIEENSLRDISDLSENKELVKVYLKWNSIKDIKPLKGLNNLKILDISFNSIEETSPLGILEGLHELELEGNEGYDIDFISNLKELRKLNLGTLGIVDITPVSNLDKLQTLKIGDNLIEDISPLRNLKNLEYLYAKGNEILDTSDLEGCTSLVEIDLSENSIEDIRSIEKMKNLQLFYASGNSISDIESLRELENIKQLSLSNNSIVSIEPLEELSKLQELDLGWNEIFEINSLEKLIELRSLDISNNRIKDISILEGLCKLEKLWIAANEIGDYTPLETLKNCEIVK